MARPPMRGGPSATSPSRKGIGRPGRVNKIMNAIYTQLVLRMRLVVVELVDAYRREHRVEDRELARGEAADHRVICCGELVCSLSFRA